MTPGDAAATAVSALAVAWFVGTVVRSLWRAVRGDDDAQAAVGEFSGCAGVIVVAFTVASVVWYASSHGLSVWPRG